MKKTILIALVAIAALSCKKETKVKADFTTAKSTYYLTEGVSFSNASTGDASYSWTFGDNTTSTEANPTHVYQVAGKYSVTLNAGGSAITKIIKVGAGTSSYQLSNSTGASLPFASYYYDGTEILDFIDHGTIANAQRSDTIYTSRTQVYVGGQINGKTFIVTSPYPTTKFGHTAISITTSTQIYVGNSVDNPSLKVLQSSANKTATSLKAVN